MKEEYFKVSSSKSLEDQEGDKNEIDQNGNRDVISLFRYFVIPTTVLEDTIRSNQNGLAIVIYV